MLDIMQDERIQQLILLQSRDRRKASSESELEQLPAVRASGIQPVEAMQARE